MILFKIVVFVFILIFALIFAYFNLQSVKISFFNLSYQLPLFMTIFAGFILGFLVAYISTGIKSLEWRRYSEKLRRALDNLWTGYPDRARGELSKLLDHEETIPLYARSMEELGQEASLYLQKYSKGIVETTIAENLFKEERERAQDLLEKALGKNWKNLKARRMLRSIYFLRGEGEKAIDLQRKVVQDSEKALKTEEKKVLASLLAEIRGEEAVSELENLPLTPSSLAVLCSHTGGRDRKKFASRMFAEGIHNETLLAVLERNSLTPEIMEEVEDRTGDVNPVVLALLYLSVGMYEKLEALKDSLPAPIRTLIDRGFLEDRECYRDMLSFLRLLECKRCGKEYARYTPLCVNCLSWNRLKIVGGS